MSESALGPMLFVAYFTYDEIYCPRRDYELKY